MQYSKCNQKQNKYDSVHYKNKVSADLVLSVLVY